MPALSVTSATYLGQQVTDSMPLFSLPILVGSAVAAGLAAWRYQPRRTSSPSEAQAKRLGVYFSTFLPGAIVAQFAWGALKIYYPTLARIDGAEALVGVVAGGAGLKLVVWSWDKLPTELQERILQTVKGPQKPEEQQ